MPPARPEPIHPRPAPTTPKPKPGPKAGGVGECVIAWARAAYAVAELTVSLAKGGTP